MVTPTTVFAVVFLLLCIAFAVGVTWVSLQNDAHSAAMHRSEPAGESG